MILRTSTTPLRDRPWLGVVASLAAVAVSYGIRVMLGPAAEGFPFVIFIPPVVLVTFCFGLVPGILAALIAGLVADITIIAAPGSIVPPWPLGWLALGFYALTVGVDIALINAMNLAVRRAARAEAGLRRANEELEQRVFERTAALEQQVADREAAEAQVRQMQKMETIGQLTGGIAHDFNNMLAVVIGSIEMARRRAERSDFERLIGSLDSAREGARRASDLVTRLLAFARQQELAPQTIDVDALIAGMSSLMRRTLGETIEVEVVGGGDLWRCWADPVQLESALLNLAVNARDAMPNGGRLTIETRNVVLDEAARDHVEAAPGAYVMIAVTDTGTGMPAPIIERAFDPFFTTKEVGKGTGLGLSQIYGFVRQSGGDVTIASEVGHGTIVRLYLPRHAGEPSHAEAAREEPQRLPLAPDAATVLVVEDEEGVRDMSVDALRELGYAVIEANGPRQALHLLEQQPQIDLIFTDIVMPEMGGRELAEAARAMRPDIKIVYTTGYERASAPEAEPPDSACLAKPFTLAALATKVRDALGNYPHPLD